MWTKLELAMEHLSKPFVNAMVLNGLPERNEHFVAQESFNPVGSFVGRRTRILNSAESRKHRDSVDDVDSHVVMTTKNSRPKHISSGMYNAAPKSSSGQLKCFCCRVEGHIKTECYKKDEAERGFRCFVTFIDENSSNACVQFMRQKI